MQQKIKVLKLFLSKKAKYFLDWDWIYENGLYEDFFLEMTQPVNLTPIFRIGDPPHCLKTLAGAVSDQYLQWDGCTMKGEMICNVWQAIELVNGEFGIDANRNFKESDFIETHDFDTMNVSSEACIFYGTTKNMLDDVINSPEKYPITNVPPSVDRKKFYSSLY